ncbi:MAG: hypothetical protein GC168_00810 [Candidatus Hydrogenedens sp.]|nr:hypothetical protein [Candidatus Hydrogenedens sp.]
MKQEGPRRLVKRPHHRRIFKDYGSKWLVVEPHRLGLAGGALFATLTLLVYAWWNSEGTRVDTAGVLVGAAATFVVGYAAIGLFVWYILHVTYVELGPPPEQEHKRRSLVSGRKKAAAEIDLTVPAIDLPDEPAMEHYETTDESELPQ